MKCKNCGKRIIKVNYAMGPEWTHQTEGASGMDGSHRECRTMIAEPEESIDIGQSNQEWTGYFEVWECPECGIAEKFNRPRISVEHDCIGDGTQRQHTVQLIKINTVEGFNDSSR